MAGSGGMTGSGGMGGFGGSPSQGTAGGASCGPCANNAQCNADGACQCETGYVGDGTTQCDDFDECFDLDEPCHPDASCTNLEGSFECACPPGTEGDAEAGGAGCFARYDAISAHSNHTCARRIDGAVFCFGTGGSGRLGNGATLNQNRPVRAGAASNWERISVGGSHVCGIKTTGNAWCWGLGSSGQLGAGNLDSQSLPAYVDLTRTWLRIGAGEAHSCAIESNGTLSCWGRNNSGQLGRGTTSATESLPATVSVDPAALVPDANWSEVSVSRDTTCAIQSGGKIHCWGVNSNLQAGRPTTGNVLVPSPVERSAGVADSDWKSVTVGLVSCGLKQDDSLHCWGRNSENQLADGTTTSSAYTKAILPGTTWKQVATGFQHLCGIQSNGTLWCWGRNASGQVGAGLPGRVPVPTQIGSDSDWTAVTAGIGHSCGLKASGEVRCWGARLFGQTGDGNDGYADEPVAVASAPAFSSLDGYGESTCGVAAAGALHCWGNGETGSFGDGLATSYRAPTLVAGAPPVAKLAVGRFHTCVAPTTGGMQCAGTNSSGNLGIGNTTPKLAFTPIASNPAYDALSWTTIDVGESHSCAIASDGTLWCWGSNCFGQVDGASISGSFTSPVKILPALGPGWSSVATGASHTCATRSDGALYCWGRNLNGQAGIGAVTVESGCNVKVAPQLVGTGYAPKLALGVNHSCALKTNGALHCWGANASGQLGNDTTIQLTTPTAIGTKTDWIEVRAGNSSTCAIDAAGLMHCWGANTFGQLGVGDLGTRRVPIAVSAEAHQAPTLGYTHACALRSGVLHCWGSGELGQNGLDHGWTDGPVRIVEAL
jgi:alpha-tubulin suppressor-like RCC1 family protein